MLHPKQLRMDEMGKAELPRPSGLDFNCHAPVATTRHRPPHTVAPTEGPGDSRGPAMLRCRRLLSASAVKDQGKVDDCIQVYCRSLPIICSPLVQ